MIKIYSSPFINKHLKYPPVKCKVQKKLPDMLVLRQKAVGFEDVVEQFTIISTKPENTGKKATMRCFPEYISRDGKKDVPSLYIWLLFSNCSGSGFGTAMLDFAKNYSKKIGCNGNFHLSSDVSFTPNRIPHPFYYKYGMNTKSPKINEQLERVVKSGKTATHRDFETIDMYYPPIEFLDTKVEKFIYKCFKFGLKTLFGISE